MPVIAVALSMFGLVVLMISSDKLVASAVELGQALRVTPMLIGVTAVAFGTSAPEMAASVLASLRGSPDLAIGNALGSNLANIGLALGLAALIWPMPLRRRTFRLAIPVMMAVTILAGALLWDETLTRLEGAILLACLPLAIWWMVDGNADIDDAGDTGKAAFAFALSLLFLLLGADALVRGALLLAELWGIDALIVGLVVVALGTSLPEIAVTVAAALRHQPMLAVGGIVGSNIFNLLGVMGLAAVIAEWRATSEGFWSRDYGAVFALSALLCLVAWWATRRQPPRFGRRAGAMLLGAYFLYLYYLQRVAL